MDDYFTFINPHGIKQSILHNHITLEKYQKVEKNR